MSNVRRSNGYRRDQLNKRHKQGHPACYICGQPIDYDAKAPAPWSYVTDEIIPIKHGGDPLSWENTAPAHWWCNRIKSTHSIAWARATVKRLMQQGKAPSRGRPAETQIVSSKWFA